MINKVLQEIGLTASEIKVYLSLLELGDSTRTNIVKNSGIAGSKVYDVLDKLVQKGLVSIYTKESVKHFKAINPKQIQIYLDHKKEKIIDLQQQTENILPQLLAKFNSSKEDQEVELYDGMSGMEIIFREQIELLKKNEACYVIGGTHDPDDETIQSFFEKIHRMREEKKIRTKMLMNYPQKKSIAVRYSYKKYPCSTTRFIKHSSPVAINIYKDRTVIIIFGKKISSIYIKSDDVANSFMEYFNILWKQSKA